MIKDNEPSFKQIVSQAIDEQLSNCDGLEEQIDALRIVKSNFHQSIKKQFQDNPQCLDNIFSKLSMLADKILIYSYRLAKNNLQPKFGNPQYLLDNEASHLSEFALIGMGKLGGNELHFGSDLDLIFVFNQNGKTNGKLQITNQEYYSRVTQRIINYLTLYTRFGFAYKVDTELRPSGNAGTLVTALSPWLRYYQDDAQTWERQALLKARLIYTDGNFSNEFENLFANLIFIKPFNDDLANEIHQLRLRVEKELAKESNTRWHYKKGHGALLDIEFCIQYLQLKHGDNCRKILQPNSMKALAQIQDANFISSSDSHLLKEAYYFYRKLEINLEIQFDLKEGYLDPNHEIIPKLAEMMLFRSEEEFIDQFKEYRLRIRDCYHSILGTKG